MRDILAPTMIPMLSLHVAALGVFLVPFEWSLVAWCLGSYAVRMFGVTAGYHRYFSHRSYKTSRLMQFLLALLAQTGAQKGVLWWASHHRDHHRYSDTPRDPHSALQRGFWYSHLWWIYDNNDETNFETVKDLARFPELVWLNRWWPLPTIAWAVGTWAAWGLPGLVWVYCLSTVLVLHGTFLINSLSHVWGTRRFETDDESRNNPLVALITLGEGWHNNHHHCMHSARQGYTFWELDISYVVLWCMARLRLIRDLRTYEHFKSARAAQ